MSRHYAPAQLSHVMNSAAAVRSENGRALRRVRHPHTSGAGARSRGLAYTATPYSLSSPSPLSALGGRCCPQTRGFMVLPGDRVILWPGPSSVHREAPSRPRGGRVGGHVTVADRSAIWYRRRAWMNWSAVPPRSGWASAMARRSSLIGGACGSACPARSRSPRYRSSSAAWRVAKNSRSADPGQWRSPGIGITPAGYP